MYCLQNARGKKRNNINNRLIADRFTGVTILYSDIVGFTTLASELVPKEVIKMLSELFTDFDSLAMKYNVYKVQTYVLGR